MGTPIDRFKIESKTGSGFNKLLSRPNSASVTTVDGLRSRMHPVQHMRRIKKRKNKFLIIGKQVVNFQLFQNSLCSEIIGKINDISMHYTREF